MSEVASPERLEEGRPEKVRGVPRLVLHGRKGVGGVAEGEALVTAGAGSIR